MFKTFYLIPIFEILLKNVQKNENNDKNIKKKPIYSKIVESNYIDEPGMAGNFICFSFIT